MLTDIIDRLQKTQSSINSCIEDIKQIIKASNDLKVSEQFLHLYADSFNTLHDQNNQLLKYFKDQVS